MARMIDADSLGIGRCNPDVFENKSYADGWNAAVSMIENAPTVDAEPVRRGKWIEVGGGFNYHFECSECGWKDGYPFNDRHKYCPNCGAKMIKD